MENELFKQLAKLRTEQVNPDTRLIDTLPTINILELINDNDSIVAPAVRREIPFIAKAVDCIAEAFRNNARLIYVGAGTSGRLGIVDASECPPTFGSSPEMVQGIIAGGKEAVFRSQEGAEDSPENGEQELKNINLTDSDIVCGIAASGRTPFVIGALNYAKELGAKTILICTVERSLINDFGCLPDIIIAPNIGAETITGSTRMKSGTAQKMILNMLTTAAMVIIGKTYGNIMVDLQPTNKKLLERSKKTLMMVTGLDYCEAEKTLINAKWHVKTAIVMTLANTDAHTAKKIINQADGKVRQAIDLITKNRDI